MEIDLGGRKFGLTLFVIAIFAGLTFVDKMTVDSFKDFCLWAMGLYFTGNVGSKTVFALSSAKSEIKE